MSNDRVEPRLPADVRNRVAIEGVSPEIDGGRFPAKRIVGDRVHIEADIFADGHDDLSALLLWQKEGDSDWTEVPMKLLTNDRWAGEFVVSEVGRYKYTLVAWVDRFKTWRRLLGKRLEADQDVTVDLQIGAGIVEETAARAEGKDARVLQKWAQELRSSTDPSGSGKSALDSPLGEIMERNSIRRHAVTYSKELGLVVDPLRARFSAWYEVFPRSWSPTPGRHGTFSDLEARLPEIAAMGFDVLYLPPIHPIGTTHRKGKNNTLEPFPEDVGSPWAIGGSEGGHKAVHPDLGSLSDFVRLVKRAREQGIELALDVAFQTSPDHPYVNSHPEWFRSRPDGTIQYAENPPKKYQDIFPFDFDTDHWEALCRELKSIFDFWIEQGVTIFRVDNPHTKPFSFWEWCIQEIKKERPEVLFLSEAFTRPKVMYRLAKVGFSQSYTYFPWRNTKHELTEYLTELTRGPVREFFRPSQWVNTPDILTAFLQHGGRPAFIIRLVLAATLGASYGVYGPAFDLVEHNALKEGSEEYLDSEKYQIRQWNWNSPDSLREVMTRINRIRKENVALQSDWGLRFHPSENDQILCYSKVTEDRQNGILVAVNLDPHHTHSSWIHLSAETFGLTADASFQVHDLLSDARYLWSGHRHYVELNPQVMPAHVFKIRRRVTREQDFDYFA